MSRIKTIKNLFELKNEKNIKTINIACYRGDLRLFFKNRFFKKTKKKSTERTPFLFCINKV